MKIRIKQYSFQLSEPYAAGSVLTLDEAKALNGLRAENIRNVMSRAVERECGVLEPGQLLDQEVLQGLQQQISDYDARYAFRARHTPTRTSALDDEIALVAREEAEAQARQLSLSTESLSDLIELLKREPRVQAAARARVAARERTFSSLEDLIA